MVTIHLAEALKDPESAAHFANAQAESAKELLKCGVIKSLDITSLSNKTRRCNWDDNCTTKSIKSIT